MTFMTGAGALGIGIQGTAQFSLTEQADQGGQLLTDFTAHCRRHHHGGCGEGGGQQNGLGQTLMRDGEQLVQDGQKLIQQGDTQDGMRLVDDGAQLEMQGAALEAQGGQGMMPGGMMPGGMMPGGMMPGGMMPGGMMPGGMNPMSGGDPCNPMGGQYGSPFPIGMNGNSGFGENCGGGGLSVNGSSVTTPGGYKITASADASGTLSVTDPCGKSFKIWGDPHISTDNGGTADFQHAPATFRLPDGTLINVKPTDNPTCPNTMSQVTITNGNDAARINFASGNVRTQHLPGQGYSLDWKTPGGTEVDVDNGDQLTVENDTSNGVRIGPNTGNIDQYASNGPMGVGNFDPIGNSMPTNIGNIAQLENIITQATQEITQILEGNAMATMMHVV